jgi:diamine N-acetyltransferase
MRDANPADIPAISRLASEAFIAKFGHLYSAENLNLFLTESLSEASILAELADPTRLYQLAADQSGALLGFAKIGLSCGFPDHARGSRAMELKQLYTAPDATGQGIGALLMDWAMDQFSARCADEVQISVYAENHGAHRFYARYGFEKVADITFQVGDHIDPEFLFARML